MEYRNFRSVGRDVSLLGFGCMRFPTLEDGKIDEAEALRLLDAAFEAGVNYYDTAYFYHNGESENFMNRALAGRERSSYLLTSKLPTVMVHSLDDAKRLYAEQRERLGREYLDFYLLHNLNGQRFREMTEFGVIDWCLELQRRGEFKGFGFSFHGSYEEFEEILSARKWDVCQIQLNYMDTEEQAGMKGYALTVKLGVPLIIMEPVKGGNLANPPEAVMELFRAADSKRSAASWALRWAAGLPNVLTVLSGMSTAEQVADNLDTFCHFQPLSQSEKAMMARAAERFRARVFNGCTACRYCMPCPAGVDIPGCFGLWNRYGMYQNAPDVARRWGDMEDAAKAKRCIECGACEAACPQKLPIRVDLKRVQETLDKVN
ncbi:MAG: aldo/keto reductase [Clostridia bacterium]|nr:aldo/keto reductase [Clostridia bacterium]